jgi:membrane protease YdiL (CAAX protease family)
LELSPYYLLVYLLGLGAPPLAAATAIVSDRQHRTVELYVVLLSLCTLFLGYRLVHIPELSARLIGYALLGVGLGYALVRWETKARSARTLGAHGGRARYVLIAIVEEVFYRGLLLQLALSLARWPVQWLAVAAVVIWFAAIHVETSFIWKLPLSLALTALALVSGSILPAITAHITYNLMVLRDDR